MICPDENVLAAFADHALAEPEEAEVRAHVEACQMCRTVLQSLQAAEVRADTRGSSTPPPIPGGGEPGLGTRVGRFLVLHPVGAGGMGVVYAAYDPELDRKVALKLVRAGRGEGGEGQRLLREAQAIARLSHPNVVSLFDVGAWGNEVFLAMEFVEGSTLTQWLKAGRAQREVLEAFVSAGEGLAAAHRAGLIHRDFKPDNVLVGQDGRVRVTDFGLARQVVAESTGEEPRASEPAPAGLLADSLTRTGTLVGTPAYMAPEQHAGLAVDARGDQFAFCVALWEALYGERPFKGQSVVELGTAVREGRLGSARGAARVPERLRRLLLRGLSPRAEDRFPSMEALLELLRQETGVSRRRRWALAGAALLGALLSIVGLGAMDARTRLMCRSAGEGLEGSWDEARREQMRQAFAATGLPYAQVAFEGSARVLDAYAQGWSGARIEACEATHVRGEQSQVLLDARMQCLSERRLALRALTELLVSADKGLVERALQATGALPRVEGCAALRALSERQPPPQEPEARQRYEAAQAGVASSLALRNAGRLAEALKVAQEAVATAEALGHAPLQADALLELALVQQVLRQYPQAEASLHRALQRAQVGRHDVAAERAVSELTLLTGALLRQHEQGHRWGELAKAILERTGEDPLAESTRLTYLGMIFADEEHHEQALTHYARALALRRQQVGRDDVGVAQLMSSQGISLLKLGRMDEGLAQQRQALAIRERELGPDHPQVAASLANIALALMSQGKATEAAPLGERALVILERALGPESAQVANALEMLGLVRSRSGQLEEAVKLLERARTLYEKLQGPEAPVLARVYSNLGGLFILQEDYASAIEPLRRALALHEKALGESHPDIAGALSKLAQAYLALDRTQEALPLLERALRITANAEGKGYAGQLRAGVHLQLGQALWTLGRERARARTLVQTALELSRVAPDDVLARQTAAQAQKWLGEHSFP